MLGGFLALLAAASFAFNSATARRAVLSGTVVQGIAITVPLGIPMFLLGAALFGQLGTLGSFSWWAILWLSLGGIAHFVWGRYFIYRAQELLGANLAGTIQQFDLLIALGLAMLILGERLTPLRAVGIVLVLIGPALAFSGEARRKVEGTPSSQLGFTPRHTEGYICVGLSSIGYGFSPILMVLGLREVGPGGSLTGGLIASIAASLAYYAFLLATGRLAHAISVGLEAVRWFALAGMSVGVSQMLKLAALSLAPVMVVQPIQRLSKLCLFVFSWLMNREHEVFNRRLILASAVSLLGAALLSVSTEVFLGLARWPDWLVRAIRWQWP